MSNKAKTTQGVQPKLRFPEFRDAGEWEEKSIGDKDFANIYKGKGISKSDIVRDGKTPCIRYGELYTHYGEVINEVISKTNCSEAMLFLSQKHDVIIPSSGETKIDIATAACVTLDNVALGGDLNIIRSPHNGIFISYYLNGSLKRQIAKLAQGDSVVHLYPSQLEKIKIHVPQSTEQQRIADCLSSLDELITAEDKKLNALQRHKKGLMQQLFPAEGETLPKLRFPEFQDAGEWEEKEVGELFNLQDGYAFSSSDFVDFASDTVQVIRITDINNHNKNESKVYIPKSSIEEMKLTKFLVEQGDLLLSLTGAAGFNFFVWGSQPALINQRTMKITLKNRANAAMKILLSSLIYNKINEHGSGQNNNLSKESLKAVKLLMPNPDEQQRIANFLSSIDDLITAQSQKLDALREHKKGLMQQLFPTADEVQE